ncbi:S24 family peptidase [Xanthomonas citri]|uniref:S24 family peptidase n=1 Tax=Xanthomonas citri TaxID=346 RepID=UPI000B5CB15E|nr:S24 family peptidase [Xanthomonas citri]ASL01789.1 cI repressor protein [Xanthomonas citri pv. vignicola]
MPKRPPDRDAPEFGHRLVELLANHNVLRRGAGAYLQRLYKVSNVTANDWLNGKFRPEIETARKIAADHGVSFDELYFGRSTSTPAPNPATSSDDDYADVIGYSQAAGLGSGAEAVEYAETHSLKFKKTSLRRRGIFGKPLAVYYGKGDSMEPTIEDGDAILFDTSDTRVVDGVLYVIQVDGMAYPEYYVKRALVADGITLFQSDNPGGDHNWKRPRRMDSKREPITVIGRVHWIGGWAD